MSYQPKQEKIGYIQKIANKHKAKQQEKIKEELRVAYIENANKLEEAFDKGFRASIKAIEGYKMDMIAEDEKIKFNEATALELETEKNQPDKATPYWNAVTEAEKLKDSLEGRIRGFKTMSEKIRHARNKVMQRDYGSTEDIMSSLQYIREYGDMLGIKADDKLMALLAKLQQQEGIDVIVNSEGAYVSSHVLSADAAKRRERTLKGVAAKKEAYQGNVQSIDNTLKELEEGFNAAGASA